MRLKEIYEKYNSERDGIEDALESKSTLLINELIGYIGWFAGGYSIGISHNLWLWERSSKDCPLELALKTNSLNAYSVDRVIGDHDYTNDEVNDVVSNIEEWIKQGDNSERLHNVYLTHEKIEHGFRLFSHKTYKAGIEFGFFLQPIGYDGGYKVCAKRLGFDHQADFAVKDDSSVIFLDHTFPYKKSFNKEFGQELTQALTDYLKALEEDS